MGIKTGIIWTSAEKLLTQLVQFVLGIIIARLITPEEYGVLGIIMVFVNVAQVFVDSGLGSALIYRNNLDKEDVQTTFSFNLIVSVVFYFLLFIFSSFIENFFHLEGLSIYLRVAALVLIFNSFVIVPTCILKIKQNFKAISLSNFLSTIFSGIAGVIFAYKGYGVWALVFQLILRSGILMLLITIQCKWLPNFSFYQKSFKGLWKYSVNLLASNSLTKFIDGGVSFIIGKLLTPYSLGLFTRGLQFATLPNAIITAVLSTVIFPAFSSFKDDKTVFYQAYRKAIVIQALIISPIYVGLIVICEPLIFLLLGEQWINVVPILQILSIGMLIVPFSYTTEQVFCALGYSNLVLRQQAYKLFTKLILTLGVVYWGLIPVVIANAITDLFAFFIINYCGRKYLIYSIKEQIKDIKFYIITAIIFGGCSYLIGTLIINPFIKIFFILSIALALYVSCILIFKKNDIKFLFEKN